MNFLKLLFIQKKRQFTNSNISLLFYSLKLVVFVGLIIVSIKLKHVFEEKHYLSNHDGLFYAQILALYFSFTRIKILNFYSTKPFWFFNASFIFKLKSFLYPFFFSTFNLLIVIISVLLWGWFGLFISIYMYTLYQLSTKHYLFQILILIFSVLIYLFPDFDFVKFAILLQLLSSILYLLLDDKFYKHNAYSFLNKRITNILVKKELLMFKYYKSDFRYLFLGLFANIVFIFYLMYFVDNQTNQIWFILFLTTMIFSTVWFNLLGTETSFLNRFLFFRNEFIQYLVKRSRVYLVLTFLFFIFFLVLSYQAIHIFDLLKILIIALFFYELINNIALIVSAYFIYVKDQEFRYGQYVHVKNFNIINIASLFLVLISGYIFYLDQFVVILILYLVVLGLSKNYLPRVLEELLLKKEYELEY